VGGVGSATNASASPLLTTSPHATCDTTLSLREKLSSHGTDEPLRRAVVRHCDTVSYPSWLSEPFRESPLTRFGVGPPDDVAVLGHALEGLSAGIVDSEGDGLRAEVISLESAP
jgi:hypothetical protein